MIKIKNKVLAKIFSTLFIIGLLPTAAMAEEIQVNNSEEAVIQDKSQLSSSSSVTTQAVDLDVECIKAKTALELLSVNNNTHESDIIDTIKNNIDKSINIEFGTGIEAFGKIISSEQKEGSISGTIYLVDSLGNKKALEIALIIAKLESSDTLPVVTTPSAVTVDVNKVVRLETNIKDVDGDGIFNIGDNLKVDVIGYNKSGEKVALDESKLSEEWFVDGKKVNQDKELNITIDRADKPIYCVVNYEE